MHGRVRVVTKSASETKRAAEFLARNFSRMSFGPRALVIALSGDLGGGKTTFTQGFARGFGIREPVTSPTFLIARMYPAHRGRFKKFIHIDAYRLASAIEMKTIGWQKWVRDPEIVIIVEWAKNIERLLPRRHIDIQFEFISDTKRAITIHAEGI